MKILKTIACMAMLGLIGYAPVILISCDKEEITGSPTIASFSPTSGIVPGDGVEGTVVTINGTNFSQAASENEVKFNGTVANVSSSTATQITTSVPAGATSGKIQVTVKGKSATSEGDFVIIPPPSVTSFSPVEGFVGMAITIIGSNFSTIPTENQVKFNGTLANISSSTGSQIIVIVPAEATSGKIQVTVHGRPTLSEADFFVIPPPVVVSFTPNEGVAGMPVTINGENFSPVVADNTVQFNGVNAEIATATTTQLGVTVPATASTGKISVTVKGQTSTSADNFINTNSPTISSFVPAAAASGTEVTIKGTNFKLTPANNIVKFNNVPAEITSVVSSEELKVLVPASATSGRITVTINSLVATSLEDFIVYQAPTISSFSPTFEVVFQDVPGSTITVAGTNFSTTIDENIVKFNGVSASVISAEENELKVAFPLTATTGKIEITVHGLAVTSANNFTVYPAPKIQSFTPATGIVGAELVITGENFANTAEGNEVRFNGVTANILSASETELRVTLPSTTAIVGKVKVKVLQHGGEVTSADNFTLTPTLGSFTPETGLPRATNAGIAGASVTITGTGFSNQAADNIVKFNGTNAVVTSASLTELIVEVPAGATTGKISVSINDQTIQAQNDFAVQPRNVWVEMAPFPGTVRTQAAGFSIGSKLYILMGISAIDFVTVLRDVWEYNLETNQWRQRADFPGVPRTTAIGFSIGNKGYVNHVGNTASQLWEYAPNEDTWTQKSSLPGSARNEPFSFAVGSKAYSGGGNLGTTYFKDVYEYNPSDDTWTQLADMPADMTGRHSAKTFVAGSKAYVCAGINQNLNPPHLYDLWQFDPASTDQWEKKANYTGPEANRQPTVAFGIGNLGFVGNQANRFFLSYDRTSSSWTRKTGADVPLSVTDPITLSTSNFGFLGPGFVAGTGAYTNFYKYIPD